MRIQRVEPFLLHVPVTGAGVADSMHQITHWGVPGVKVILENGVEGCGFAGTHAHLPTDRLITGFIDQVCGPLLIGESFGPSLSEVDRLTDKVFHFPPSQWLGRAGLTHVALGAVNTALWDLAAKQAGQPLWKILRQHRAASVAGSPPETLEPLVAYNTDIGWLDRTVDQLTDNAKRACQEEGFRAVKMKVGKPELDEDISRVAAVRQAIGDAIVLMVDANGKWNLATALAAAPRLADLGVQWVEEPLWYDDVAAHAELVRAGGPAVALGEQLYNAYEFSNFMRADAVHVVQPDVTRLCGVSEWCTVTDAAIDGGFSVVAHAGDMGQVHAHTSYGYHEVRWLEYIPWIRHCFEEPVTVRDGLVAVPQDPGAGTSLRSDAIERFGQPWR